MNELEVKIIHMAPRISPITGLEKVSGPGEGKEELFYSFCAIYQN